MGVMIWARVAAKEKFFSPERLPEIRFPASPRSDNSLFRFASRERTEKCNYVRGTQYFWHLFNSMRGRSVRQIGIKSRLARNEVSKSAFSLL